jgi:hypothetical protein
LHDSIFDEAQYFHSRRGPSPHWFRDEIQEDPEQKARRNGVRPSLRTRAVQMLGRGKHAACFPIAFAAFPYVKYCRFVGPYLYCLARKSD